MKKKYILPCLVLALSVVSCVIMTVFTTEYMFAKGLMHYDYNQIVKNAKYTEFAHKINPSYSTLAAVSSTYSNRLVYDVDDYNEMLDRKYVTEEYLEKMVKYSKEKYDRVYSDGKTFTSEKQVGFYKSGGLLSVVYPFGDYSKAIVSSDYAVSLYLAGKGEESQKVIETYLNSLDGKTEYAHSFIYGYINVVHRLEFNEDFQRWMVDIEEKVTEDYYASQPDNENKTDNMFKRADTYVPFDWQK